MSSTRKVSKFLFTLTVLLSALFIYYNYQEISDQIRFRQYEPSAQVESLSSRSDLSGRGKFYFYVAHPKIEKSAEFNQDCRKIEGGSAVLGCYVSGVDTIHIYDVDNPELDGVKEVTAAHEMLHVVYSRLSSNEKQRLSPLLEEAYKTVETPRLAERMDYYKKTQPGSRENELHSILGTEFLNIGGELEKYYSKYFNDRSKVVKLHDGYNQKFDDIERRADELTNKLNKMRPEIEAMTQQYDHDLSAYNSRVFSFNSRADSGWFSSQYAFDIERKALVSEASRLEQYRLNSMQVIDEYNRDVETLNELGRQAEQLNRSLDSSKAVE